VTGESQEAIDGKKSARTATMTDNEQAQRDMMDDHCHHTDENSEENAEGEEEKRWYEYLIISVDNPWKSNFDIVVLFLVAYSCFASLYSVAFSEPSNRVHIIWD